MSHRPDICVDTLFVQPPDYIDTIYFGCPMNCCLQYEKRAKLVNHNSISVSMIAE